MVRTSITKRLILAAFTSLSITGIAWMIAGSTADAQVVVPFFVNDASVGNSPKLTFPVCEAGTSLGTVSGPLSCVSAGGGSGGVEAGADGTILVSTGGNEVWGVPTGDLSMAPSSNFTVTGLQTNPVATTAPSSAYVLTWNGSAWAPASIPTSSGSSLGSIKLTTDLGGTAASPDVVGLQAHALPVFGGVGALQTNGSTWSVAAVSLANLSPGTAGQIVQSNGTPAAAWTTVTGDTVISSSGVTTTEACTGSGGVCSVPNGTDVSFATTGQTDSTNGRINFTADGTQTLIGWHYSGADYSVLHTDGFGTITIGDSAHTPETDLDGLDLVRLNCDGQLFQISNSTGEIALNGSAFTFNDTPAFFTSTSNPTIGGTSADYGGMAGGMSFAPVTTASTAAPATNDNVQFTPIGLVSVSPAATSTNLAGYGIAPIWQGTLNTQMTLPVQPHGGWATTTNASPSAVAYSLSLGISQALGLHIECTGRVILAGGAFSVGDFTQIDYHTSWTNVSSALTQAGTPNTVQTGSASMSGTTVTTSNPSGDTINVNVVEASICSGSCPSIDWACRDVGTYD